MITDKNNCKLKKEFEIAQPDKSLEVSYKKTDVDCYGSKTGSIIWMQREESPDMIMNGLMGTTSGIDA